MSSPDYDKVQEDDVEEDEEDDDSIEDYERGAVAATGTKNWRATKATKTSDSQRVSEPGAECRAVFGAYAQTQRDA